MKNYYTILGIAKDATHKTINEAYKKLALKFHPDKNPDDLFFAAWFKEINEAKQLLNDEIERAEYDFKLNNYADAYELLKQQQADEQNERIYRRQRFIRVRSNRKKWWVSSIIMIILISLLFFLKDNDSKAFRSEEGEFMLSPTENKEIAKSNSLLPQPALDNASIINDSLKMNLGELKKIESDLKVLYTQEQKKEPVSYIRNERNLNASEVNKILQLLKAESSTNCVKVVQSAKGNIKKDFSIVSTLQRNGYIITGREITNNNENGLSVKINGNCLKLIIGKLGSN